MPSSTPHFAWKSDDLCRSRFVGDPSILSEGDSTNQSRTDRVAARRDPKLEDPSVFFGFLMAVGYQVFFEESDYWVLSRTNAKPVVLLKFPYSRFEPSWRPSVAPTAEEL